MADELDQAGGIPRIGDLAPDFEATSTEGTMVFSQWAQGSWVMLFSHPADFTPVCSTELVELARRHEEFQSRGVKLLGLSIDSVHSHLAWRENLRDLFDVELGYPLVADHGGRVAALYGMLHPGESETLTVRAVFFVDPRRVIRALVYYPLNVGRSVDELLRVIDGLQTADEHGVACPVNWSKGEKVIVPPPRTTAEVEDRRLASHEMINFYLCRKSLGTS